MSRNAETIKRLRLDAVARGLCYVCRCRFPRPGVRSCDECLERGRAYQKGAGRSKRNERSARITKRRRDRMIASGICTRCCRLPACDGRTQCSVCLDEMAARNIERARRRGAQPKDGACSYCGQFGHTRRRHERPGILPTAEAAR